MPFINEKISDEDTAKAHWEQYSEYQNQWKMHPSWWTIDRDRDAFFWHIKGPMPEWPNQTFGLYWKGAVIRVEAIETLKSSPVTGDRPCDVYWDVVRLNVSEVAVPEQGQIQSILKDALVTYGRNYRRNTIGNVFVFFR